MATRADCDRLIREAAQGRLTDDELEAIIEDLDRIRQKRAAEGSGEAIDEALLGRADEIAQDLEIAAMIEKRNRLINVVKRAELAEMARRADAMTGDPSLGLEAVLVGVNAPIVGGRRSVDATANGMLRTWLGGMVADLRADGLLAKFNSGELSRDIARELWDLSLEAPTGKATDSADAKGIARIIHKYRREAVRRENRAGAYIRYRQGYVTRQTHDGYKMERAGRKAWAEAVAPRLDWDAMDVPPEQRAEFLNSAWEALVTRVRKGQGPENDLGFAFKGPGNLAKKDSASRVLLFKSADDWFEYDQKFGRRSLNEAILADFQRAAQSTALMDRLGTNPRAMFDGIRDDLRKRYRDDPKKVKRLDRKRLDWAMDEVDGTVNLAANHSLALVGRTVRAVQSMAKLGGAFISSIADVANVAATRRADGRSLGDAWTDAVKAPIEGFATRGEQRRTAELLGVGIDGMLGDFVSRFAAQDDAPGKINKTMALFFKLNLLGPWTDAVKRGAGLMTARDLAMDATKQWGALSGVRRRELGRYGLDDAKWEVARKAVEKGDDGRLYLLPASVERVPIDGMNDRAAKRLRDDVRDSLAAYVADIADSASPTPGARERSLLRMGAQPGTPLGEAIRFVMQFKAFPVTIASKTLGRMVYGRGANSVGAALFKGEGDVLGLAAFIAGSGALGFMAMQAKEIAKGREPRQVDQSSITAGMLQGGGLGIYGDFLLGETNRFGNSLLDTLAGPTLGTLADVDKIRAKAMAGDDVGGDLIRLAQGNTPFANLFWTKTALDYLVVHQLQEIASPGYLRRMERRIKRENGQKFFLPPSSTIPRGGGDRLFEGVRD